MLSTLTKCLRMIPRDLRWSWFLTAPLSLATAGLETATAGAIYLLTKMATAPADLASMPIVSSFGPIRTDDTTVFLLACLFVLFYLGKTAFIAWAGYARELALGRASVRISSMFLRAYMRAPYSFHLRRNSSGLIHHVNASVDRAIGGAMSASVGLFLEILTVCSLVAAMLVAAPVVTLTVGAVIGLFLWLFLRRTRAEMVRFGEEAHRLSTAMLERVRQGLGAIKEIKVLGREDHFLHAYDGLQHDALRARARRRALLTVPRLGMEVIFAIGGLCVLGFHALTGEDRLAAAPLLAIYAYGALRLRPVFNHIPALIAEIRWCEAPVDRLYRDYTTLLGAASAPGLAAGRAAFSDRLAIERVSFAYDGAPEPALQDIDLAITRGESVGIVGATGAGKTTLMDLIIGLIVPTTGRVTVDGRDLRESAPAWQQQIGYVPQTIYLIDDSIRRNIALGLPDEAIDEQRVRAAVTMANLDDVVGALPGGLDSTVGEQGIRLSGGQRQRIGIARALYHDPAVLVFDEATSSLDSVTETEVIRAVEALQGRKTLIVIAHRLSTVRSCQRLIFLSGGRLQATGRFDELLCSNLEFRRMAQLSGLTPPSSAEREHAIEHVAE
jgi:ATP-binding cassette subfamily C protein